MALGALDSTNHLHCTSEIVVSSAAYTVCIPTSEVGSGPIVCDGVTIVHRGAGAAVARGATWCLATSRALCSQSGGLATSRALCTRTGNGQKQHDLRMSIYSRGTVRHGPCRLARPGLRRGARRRRRAGCEAATAASRRPTRVRHAPMRVRRRQRAGRAAVTS